MDQTKKDADLQSDEQNKDLVVEVPADTNPNDSNQDQDKGEDPSDKLTPDHPRFKDVLSRAKSAEEKAEQLEEELRELREKREEANLGGDELTPEEQASLEKIEKNLAKRGFIRQDDLRVQRNADALRDLGKVYDGKNGLPKFDRAEVVAYAKSKGFGDNYEAAYKDMHFDAIVEQRASKVVSKPPLTEKPSGGADSSSTKKFTRADIANMSDQEYEKYREGLLNAIKPK